jgi:hypothetical protein
VKFLISTVFLLSCFAQAEKCQIVDVSDMHKIALTKWANCKETKSAALYLADVIGATTLSVEHRTWYGRIKRIPIAPEPKHRQDEDYYAEPSVNHSEMDWKI